MPSRLLDLVRPRTLALLAAGLAAGRLKRRHRTAEAGSAGEVRPPEPYRFPAPLVGASILVGCGIAAFGILGWTALRDHAQTRAVAIALTKGQPDHAPALLIRYGCAGCHAIPGVPGADGRVAAPLTGMRARVYVGGVVPNTADNLIRWIVDPPSFSPRTAMPVTGISESEARDVAAYLYTR